MHLVDSSRRDPYKPSAPRELMVSIWYPAADVAGAPARPWLSPSLTRIYADSLAQIGAASTERLTIAPSHGHLGAPAEISRGPRPIVVFSPGMGMPRELSTAHVEDLASHGFVVVTLSHTYESLATEFPGGRIERSLLPPTTDPGEVEAQGAIAIETRVADTRFVLDRLADITAGNNPDADQHPLPANLARVLDVSKVGMFGHSLGGATAAQAMHDDRRIAAAANLDGRLWGSVVTDGLDRPFMLINGEGHDRDDVPSWKQFWATSHGPKLNFRLNGAQHQSFCDTQLIAAPLVAAGLIPSAAASQVVGTIDPRKSLDVQLDYLRSFFDTTLGRYDDLAQLPATLLHPEMVLVP
ncbi:alpha/beta hydrolase family protein [Nocardia sp. NPDC058480]|uniref:alpha/beta hydrolase family protein n=1 Tax=unclassified Nocardia TaxID=2637762 RepID=UPI0036524A1F